MHRACSDTSLPGDSKERRRRDVDRACLGLCQLWRDLPGCRTGKRAFGTGELPKNNKKDGQLPRAKPLLVAFESKFSNQ